MRAQVGVKMVLVALILALTVTPGLARGAPAMASPASTSGGLIWRTATVDSSGDRGTHTDIAFDPYSGTPWVSYYDEGNGGLMVAHRVGSAGNCGPNNDWYCETVDSAPQTGQYTSIDVYNPGTPYSRRVGVAYFNGFVGLLRFAEYQCSPGIPPTCSWSPVTIETYDFNPSSPLCGRYPSIRYDATGRPHIAYYCSRSSGVEELRLAYRRDDTSGNCGVGPALNRWTCNTVDSGEGVGQYASMDIGYSGSNPIPYIAYYDGGSGDLMLAMYAGGGGNTSCTSPDWQCISVDGASADVGQSVSFEWDSALHFAYYDATHGKLRYAVSVGSGGNCGPNGSLLCYNIQDATSPSGFRSISLATDGADHPLIAYRYSSGLVSQLRVAQPAENLSGNCGQCVVGVGCSWQCLTVDTESGLGDIASHVSADFDPDGLPMIAYSEWSYNPIGGSGDYDLRIAYGRWGALLPLVLRNNP